MEKHRPRRDDRTGSERRLSGLQERIVRAAALVAFVCAPVAGYLFTR